MSLRNIVIMAVIILLVMIAVLEWFLCLALSRSKRKRPDDEDRQQEEFLRSLNEMRTTAGKENLQKDDGNDKQKNRTEI